MQKPPQLLLRAFAERSNNIACLIKNSSTEFEILSEKEHLSVCTWVQPPDDKLALIRLPGSAWWKFNPGRNFTTVTAVKKLKQESDAFRAVMLLVASPSK